jgi:hypothetical protein
MGRKRSVFHHNQKWQRDRLFVEAIDNILRENEHLREKLAEEKTITELAMRLLEQKERE